VQFTIDPFVAGRFLLKYAQERRFLEEPEENEAARHSAAIGGERMNPGAWSDLPPEVRSNCDQDETYVLAVTAVETPGTLKAKVDQVEEAECDPCLLGAWDIDADSFEAFLDRLMQQTGMGALPIGGTPEIEIGGHDYLQFGEDGKLDTRRVDFQISIGIGGASGLVTTTDAQGSGDYSAGGEELQVMNLTETVNEIEVSGQGQGPNTLLDPQAGTYSVLGNTFAAPGLSSAVDGPNSETTAQYVCGEHTLEITLPEFGEVLYNRVDRIIPTPVPTPSQ
jgi:hypothetical protein